MGRIGNTVNGDNSTGLMGLGSDFPYWVNVCNNIGCMREGDELGAWRDKGVEFIGGTGS